MVFKFVVAEAVKNQEFFRDNLVNFTEFSNDRIPILIKKKNSKGYLFGLNGQR